MSRHLQPLMGRLLGLKDPVGIGLYHSDGIITPTVSRVLLTVLGEYHVDLNRTLWQHLGRRGQ